MSSARLKHATVGPPAYGLNVPASEYQDHGIRLLRITDITDDGLIAEDAEPVFVEEILASEAPIERGDLLISRSGTVGRSYLHDGASPATYAGYLVRFRPKRDVEPRFLFYWTKSKDFGDQVHIEGTQSTIINVNAQKYANMRLPLPQHETQKAIADFLDRETERIDGLVEKKRRLIELLEEKRTALISQAVTKGLDPTVPMKDSGIPWLGEIPAHWDLVTLGRLCTLQRGFDLPKEIRQPGPYPLISSGGVVDHVAAAMAKGPGVVTGRYGSVGEVYFTAEDYWPLNTSLFSLAFHNADPRFVYYLLRHLPLEAESGKSAVPGVSRQDIHPMPVGRPPSNEQVAIAHHLDEHEERIDSVIARIDEQLDKLAEYRQALITAAVTGQIDVTERSPDPEEAIA